MIICVGVASALAPEVLGEEEEHHVSVFCLYYLSYGYSCCLFCLNDNLHRQCRTAVLNDESGVQLTRCSVQTEGMSGRTVEQPPPSETRVDKEGHTKEAVPTLTVQQGTASTGAVDAAIADPWVG